MPGNAENTVYFSDRKKWRGWLAENFDRAAGIWLIFPHKDSDRKRMVYNDAVEEALCFGWIDSTVKKHDRHSSKQRFSPRRRGSSYSQQNRERLRWLHEQGLLHPSVIPVAEKVLAEPFVFPEDILARLKQDKQVWQIYRQFSESYRRIRIAYIDSARSQPDLFEKRLQHFINKTRNGKQIGYGGIDKYF